MCTSRAPAQMTCTVAVRVHVACTCNITCLCGGWGVGGCMRDLEVRLSDKDDRDAGGPEGVQRVRK
eukprot:1675186-Rhodomonas_salina.1